MKLLSTFITILTFALSFAACSSTGWYKSSSSGQIGCPEDDVEISNESSGITTHSWVATCHGKRFYCSSNATGGLGGHTVNCRPEAQ